MKFVIRLTLGLFGPLFLLTLSAFAQEVEKQTIQVKFKPTSIIKKGPSSTSVSKIFFEPLKNRETDADQVGENLETSDKRVLIVTANAAEISQLIVTALAKEFQDMGFSVVNDSRQADRIIGGQILKFWSVETRLYETVVRLRMEIKDLQGGVLMSKIFAGSAKRFGRSLKQDNYNETFSDSVLEIIETIFADSEFMRAL